MGIAFRPMATFWVTCPAGSVAVRVRKGPTTTGGSTYSTATRSAACWGLQVPGPAAARDLELGEPEKSSGRPEHCKHNRGLTARVGTLAYFRPRADQPGGTSANLVVARRLRTLGMPTDRKWPPDAPDD